MIRIAETKYGKVEGLPAADPRVTAFKGIPFAAPPVGENRWRPPQPLAPWEGVYKAYQFGPISFQDTPGLGTDIYCREWHVDPEIPVSEDSLYLNIWTNAKSAEEKLPVLVWIYGGAFQWGYTAEMEFDGERIARRGVVVVTIAYRLGAFGFLTHPELTETQPEAPGNFGLLDQQAGLRWVKENIAAFGGDPENITLAGQSAGGASVLTQITSDTNRGYIDKAIILSGMFRSPYHEDPFITPKEVEQAQRNGADFFEYLGVKNLDEARRLDAVTIRDKYAKFRETHPMFAAVVDHTMVVGNPLQRFANGEGLPIPVMAGHTMDEFKDYLCFEERQEKEVDAGSLKDLTDAAFKAAEGNVEKEAKTLLGDDAEKFLTFEEAASSDGTGYGGVNVIELGVKSAFMAKQKKTKEPCYFYQFDVDIPGEDNPGSFHSVDLWFFFETLAKCSRPYVGRHYDIARQMCNYWCNFIKTGDPNGKDIDGSPMERWEPYTEAGRAGVRFTGYGVEKLNQETPFKSFLEEYIIRTKF